MSFLKEFREFAMKGNVVDMAVGVIIRISVNSVSSAEGAGGALGASSAWRRVLLINLIAIRIIVIVTYNGLPVSC